VDAAYADTSTAVDVDGDSAATDITEGVSNKDDSAIDVDAVDADTSTVLDVNTHAADADATDIT
jgi:hypothetical protein